MAIFLLGNYDDRRTSDIPIAGYFGFSYGMGGRNEAGHTRSVKPNKINGNNPSK